MADDPLETYRTRRDLDRSPEPAGGRRSPSQRPIFVIQEHAASSHHYDLRLEADGILASWAVPQGPSTDPDDKRLAVRTEDHPLDYADFEGSIPQDEYGGGQVIVWDIGPYENLTERDGEAVDVTDALAAGHVKVWLEGDKLRGAWTLQHAKVGGDDDNWLLIKLDDEASDARRNPTSTQRESVLSDRTIADRAGDD